MINDGKKHVNIPVFIPHLGCPNQCVFCNQRYISGTENFEIEKVRPSIEEALSTVSADCDVEIAFFGGSFTGIDYNLMRELLMIAESYISAGRVKSIRLSTRPDYISDSILNTLSKFHVKTVELGIQSTSDKVLAMSKRGHTLENTRAACSAILQYGFELVGQMMIGLPGATVEDEIATATFICDAGASAARIYPTIVFKHTELCDMCLSGEYTPLSLDDAVERSAAVAQVFESRGVKLLRVGLCESENLHGDSTYFAGPNHPAIGELVISALMRNAIYSEIENSEVEVRGKDLTVYVAPGMVSKAVGHKKSNTEKIRRDFSPKSIKVLENRALMGYNIIIEFS